MTDFIAFPPPNALGEAFSESGITGGGGGAVSTYTLSASVNEVVLTPNGGGTVTQVNVANLPAVLALTTKTQNISYANLSTIITNNVAVPGNLILDDNVLTTTGTGGSASLSINGNAIGGSASTWANFPAISSVSIPSPYNLTINGGNVLSGGVLPTVQMNADLRLGTGSSHFPDFIAYPVTFQVGSILTPANTISMRSGVGGTTIGSVQGVSIQAGIDVNITALGVNTITGANTNIVGALITNTGNVVVTGTLTANGVTTLVGTTSVGGNFNVAGVATFNGATIMNGDLNVNAITTLTGATFINGACAVTGAMTATGGVAVSGGLGVTGVTTFNGSITQSVGGIATSNITDYANTGLTINPTGNMSLVNLSSINGLPYVAGTNTPWYTVLPQNDVNFNNSSIFGVARLSGNPDSAFTIDSYLTTSPSTCGITLDARSNGSIVMDGGDVSIIKNLNISGNTSINGNLALKGSTITGVSTINGAPYGGSASAWATFPATSNVNLAGSNINNVKIINAEPTQNFSLVNALTATNIQGGSQLNLNASANGANVVVSAGITGSVIVQSPMSVSTITNVSSINGSVYPPPATAPWYTVPAGGNVDMVNFNFSNVGNITSPAGDTSFVIGGANNTSFIKINDGAGGNLAFPNMTFQTTNQSPYVGDDLIRFSTSTAWFDGEINVEKLLVVNGGADFGDININTSTIQLFSAGSYIEFPDGSKQNTAGGQQTNVFVMVAGNYNTNDKLIFNSSIINYNAIYKTTPSNLVVFSSSSGNNVDTFSPLISGIYTISLDTGAGSSCDTNDTFQTDNLYAVQVACTNQPSGYMVGYSRYQILSGQDPVLTLAPTMGSFTALFTAGNPYRFVVSSVGTSVGKTAFLTTGTPLFTITYLGINIP
jgi:hypothetical protein